MHSTAVIMPQSSAPALTVLCAAVTRSVTRASQTPRYATDALLHVRELASALGLIFTDSVKTSHTLQTARAASVSCAYMLCRYRTQSTLDSLLAALAGLHVMPGLELRAPVLPITDRAPVPNAPPVRRVPDGALEWQTSPVIGLNPAHIVERYAAAGCSADPDPSTPDAGFSIASNRVSEPAALVARAPLNVAGIVFTDSVKTPVFTDSVKIVPQTIFTDSVKIPARKLSNKPAAVKARAKRALQAALHADHVKRMSELDAFAAELRKISRPRNHRETSA